MALRVIIYGGNGALGKVIVNHFKTKNHYVASIDLAPNESADDNIIIKNLSSWTEQHAEVSENVGKILGGNKVDAIFCVAGGWAGGNAASTNYVKNADMMWKQSAWSSIIAGNLASQYLKEAGLLQLTGASPALGGTSGMIGYGMAKAAVHQLCKSLAADNSGMPPNSSTLCILPITLDTPMNRKNMPNADFSSWTSLEFIAELFCSWAKGDNRAESGSLLQIKTENGKTELTSV